jgi:hypothetical protein
MKIDKSHRSWFVVSVVILGVCTAWYAHYVTRGEGALNGPRGGSWTGLAFGVLGSAFMLFAGLLGARKRVRTWRIGRAEFWMRGHLWLGFVSLPIIWFHGGFAHGGTLTTVLMWLLYAIVVSGLLGAALQHFVPRQMTRLVPNETIYDQIPQVIRHLAVEADDVAAVCGPLNGEDITEWRQRRVAALNTRKGKALMTEERRDELVAFVNAAPVSGAQPMKELYLSHVRPYLTGDENGGGVRSDLDDSARATSVFTTRKLLLPANLHEPIADLERICGEVRNLRFQQKLHRWLHAWLLVHVPLSAALLVLGLVHAVMALKWI